MFALALLIPLFLILAIAIKLGSCGPVFFKQERIGKEFRPFLLYKFRSMVVDAPEKGSSVTVLGDPRITRIGRFLRRTKIDELPQLLNVLKGEMSIVGPRPEVRKYVELFRDDYKEILAIKPGLTDYAAIEFSKEEEILKKYTNPELGYINELLPSKIKLYKKYLNNMGFLVDLRLICLTARKIFVH